jgi:hypothetical protein
MARNTFLVMLLSVIVVTINIGTMLGMHAKV